MRGALQTCFSAAAVALLATCTPAMAQNDTYEIVDPGVADVSGAAQQLRLFPVDLSPHGFERTYKVPGRNDLLMRTNGALYAVFDDSEYRRDPRQKKKVVYKHVVPAATIFYIGRPDFQKIKATGMRAANLQRPSDQPVPDRSIRDKASGAERMDYLQLGPDLSLARSHRVDGVNPPKNALPDGDATYPVAKQPEPPEEQPRAQRPGFSDRIDGFMKRAAKGT